MKNKQVRFLTCILLMITLVLSACTSITDAQNQEPANSQTSPEFPQKSISTLIPSETALPPQPPFSNQVLVTENDAGKDIQLSVGDTLVVTLESNPSTGYTWVVESSDNAVLEQTGDPVYKSESNLMGASGKLSTVFTAIKTGQQTLTLDYLRTFEKGVAPIKTFQITVTVGSGTTSGAEIPALTATPS